jgi:hypothetical protein
MKYHQRTLELIGRLDLPLDPARGAAAAHDAAGVGVTLPAAVAEWYCVSDRSDLWRWYSCEHSPAVWRKEGTHSMVRSHPETEGDYREWWVNPPIRRDLSEWVKGPILPLMCENQACWEWGVVLDGTPDPPAVISFGGTWDTCADAFSTYVYAILFDTAPLGPAAVGRHVRVEECVTERHRRALREAFRIEPTTRGAGCVPGVFTERFSRPGKRLNFFNSTDCRFSCWALGAADADRFAELLREVGSIFPALSGVVPASGAEGGDGEIPY